MVIDLGKWGRMYKKQRDTKNDITFEYVFAANQFNDYYTKRCMSNRNYISDLMGSEIF